MAFWNLYEKGAEGYTPDTLPQYKPMKDVAFGTEHENYTPATPDVIFLNTCHGPGLAPAIVYVGPALPSMVPTSAWGDFFGYI
jgi:hypothetical protein